MIGNSLKASEGDLIALTGGLSGDLIHHLRKKGPEAAQERLRKLQDIFGDRLYLELSRMGNPEWKTVEPDLFELSKTEGIPLVATNDVHYLNREDQLAQEVLVCIGSNKNDS